MKTEDFNHNVLGMRKMFLLKEKETTLGGEINAGAILQLF